jgi:hypothetical protein
MATPICCIYKPICCPLFESIELFIPFSLGLNYLYLYVTHSANPYSYHYSRKLTMTMPSEAEFKEILRNPYRDDPPWQEWADEESSSEDDDVTESSNITLPETCVCQLCR